MKARNGNSKLLGLMGLLFCAVFCLFTRDAAADSSYGTQVSVGNPALAATCSGGGLGQASASTSCSNGVMSGSASANLISGGASASVTGPDGQSSISWNLTGTVAGPAGSMGTFTFADYGITSTTADGDALVSLGIEVGSNSGLNSVCASTAADFECEPIGGTLQVLSTSASVEAGQQITLFFNMSCGTGSDTTNAACSVSDPATLTLSPGLTFDTTLSDFLTGSTPTASTPEPSSVCLLGAGIVALSFFWRVKLNSPNV